MGEETRWERIAWDDEVPLPVPGQRLTLGVGEGEQVAVHEYEVLEAWIDPDEGWIQVHVRRVT